MSNNFKRGLVLIFILFGYLILPFNVWAKQTNTFIKDSNFDNEELISGDTVSISNAFTYIPIEQKEFELYYGDKVTNIEYYIIDSIDSNGNIKYKKYVYSDSNKSLWNPESSSVYYWSGELYSEFVFRDNVDYYNSCPVSVGLLNGGGVCNIILPAINGKISRWRFDSKEFGDKKDIDVCSYDYYSSTKYSSCDKTEGKTDNTYIGTYEYYTSYTYRFYELPEEQPKLKVTCDTNELKNGESTKCKVNFSYKYDLSNVIFNITSDKLKISNLEAIDEWYVDYSDDDVSFDYFSNKLTNDFPDDTEIATFEITSNGNVDDILASLTVTDFSYIDKRGDNNLDDFNLDFDLGKDKDNKDVIGDIINPNTFRDNYYLIIGILIIGGICFIQLKSKKKSK